MRNLTKIAAALAIAAMPLAAQAQTATEQAAGAGQAPPELTPEQLENLQRGLRIIRAFTAAFTSEDVSEAVKGRLVTCLYGNTLAQIATATGQVFANNPNLKYESPTDLYRAAAGVCGIVFRRVAPEVPASRAPGGAPPAEGESASPPDGEGR
jgi:hypothetical protein